MGRCDSFYLVDDFLNHLDSFFMVKTDHAQDTLFNWTREHGTWMHSVPFLQATEGQFKVVLGVVSGFAAECP